MNNNNEMTTEDYKKQQELDAKPFKEITTEQQIDRLVRIIQDLRRGSGYTVDRVANLESRMYRLETHEHGEKGDVLVKLNSGGLGGGSVAGNSAKLNSKDLLS